MLQTNRIEIKKCRKCYEDKAIKDFCKNLNKKDGINIYCRSCASERYFTKYKERQKQLRDARYKNNKKFYIDKCRQYSNTLKGRFIGWKNGAKSRGILWDLNFEDIKDKAMFCYYTGIPLTCKDNENNTISLDRLNNSSGYVKENVVFCSSEINYMKGSHSKAKFFKLCKSVINFNS